MCFELFCFDFGRVFVVVVVLFGFWFLKKKKDEKKDQISRSKKYLCCSDQLRRSWILHANPAAPHTRLQLHIRGFGASLGCSRNESAYCRIGWCVVIDSRVACRRRCGGRPRTRRGVRLEPTGRKHTTFAVLSGPSESVMHVMAPNL